MTISIGEGSRGGHVIGHTKSGKPVYASGGRNQGFTKQDHRDASALHDKAGDRAFSRGGPAVATARQHWEQAFKHESAATAGRGSGMGGKSVPAGKAPMFDSHDWYQKARWNVYWGATGKR